MMTVPEETLTWAWILAIAAGSNWTFGNRSAFGRKLSLRTGKGWRTTRWAGLALFVFAVTAHNKLEGIEFLPLLALFGAFVMSIGTARKRVSVEASHEQRTPEKDAAQQPTSADESK